MANLKERHDRCGGGVIVLVAEDDNGSIYRCLNCGQSQNVAKGGTPSIATDEVAVPVVAGGDGGADGGGSTGVTA